MTRDKRKIYGIVGIVIIVLTVMIVYRIYDNIVANKERAARVTQGRASTVETAMVGRKDVQPNLSFSANLEPVWTADLSPKVDGRISSLMVNEGDMVKAGSVVAVLDVDELLPQVTQAEGSVYSARATLEQAELDFKRATALSEQGAISVQSLDTARIKRDLAIGQLQSAEGYLAQLRARLGNANIIAPRSGIITKRYLQAGYYAKTGTAIVNLADTSSLLAKASVGEAEISQLRLGLPAIVKIGALGGKEFNGTVTRLTPAATLPARTFTAEITIPNYDGVIKTGMFAQVIVPGDIHKNALVVPESALVLREDQKSVYVVGTDKKVRQRILKLGYVGGGWAEVLDGVKEGEVIVTSGQNKLRDGSNIDAPAGEGE